jgi:hypothetical protein
MRVKAATRFTCTHGDPKKLTAFPSTGSRPPRGTMGNLKLRPPNRWLNKVAGERRTKSCLILWASEKARFSFPRSKTKVERAQMPGYLSLEQNLVTELRVCRLQA